MTRRIDVSVCMPTRDRAAYLGEALRSALAQEVAGLEVVVCDDGSRDGTRQVVEEVADRRVRYVRHRRPRGVAAARNTCVAAARGELIAWLDSDDAYEPGALRRLGAALEADATLGLVHGRHAVIDGDGRRLPDWPPAFPSDRVEEPREAFAELSLENYVAAPTVMVRRAAIERAGGYCEGLRRGEDWHMWLRIAREHRIAYLARRLARYRFHPDSLSGVARTSLPAVASDARVIDRVFGKGGSRIEDRDRLAARARLALAARALIALGDAYTRGDLWEALAAARFAGARAPGLDPALARELRAAIRARDDYRVHVAARAALRTLAGELEGSRFAERLGERVRPDPEWRGVLEELAGIVREVVPAHAEVAVADKWDPTLRHLSGRPGRTFPDRRLLSGGYPADCSAASRHLERVREDGARFLVFTPATLWWLDHYPGLATHLEGRYRRAWEDDRCLIYDLG